MSTALGIKCGKCKGYHPDVEAVRKCAESGPDAPPTEKQMEYLYILADKHPESPLQPNTCSTKKQASEMITAFLALGSTILPPVKPRTPPFYPPKPAYVPPAPIVPPYEYWKDNESTTGVPKGRYAIDIDGTTKFYRWFTGRGRRSKFAWYLDYQAGDRFIEVTDKAERTRVFAAIMIQGIDESRKRYGIMLGHCGYCGRTLTNDVSRAYGIGPECRGKYGFH